MANSSASNLLNSLSNEENEALHTDLGAGQEQRVRQGHRVSALFSLAWGPMVLVVFLSAAGPIVSAFNDYSELVTVTARYLRIVALSHGFMGIADDT